MKLTKQGRRVVRQERFAKVVVAISLAAHKRNIPHDRAEYVIKRLIAITLCSRRHLQQFPEHEIADFLKQHYGYVLNIMLGIFNAACRDANLRYGRRLTLDARTAAVNTACKPGEYHSVAVG